MERRSGTELDKNWEMGCRVGALLYSPALNEKMAESVINEKFGRQYSLALCLEDAISDDYVLEAERQLADTVRCIFSESRKREFFLPMIFIRVRDSQQMLRLYKELEPCSEILTGFVFPKYCMGNADGYNSVIRELNSSSGQRVYMMPILEGGEIADFAGRREALSRLKQKIDSVREYVLNVRVGGNDLSNLFGLRRHSFESIYEILPVAHILGDILEAFSREYIVSGPVWEYFSGEDGEWKRGLENEIRLDRLNGFVGKTVIHPMQIDVVNQALKVSRKDYDDAIGILDWEKGGLQVGKSRSGERMNEVKTHLRWARRMMLLADIYGVK